MGKRNGFLVASEKGTAEETTECCDVGLGLMMQKTHQSFPRKKMMMMMPHHHDHHEQSLLSSGGSFGGEGCGVFEHSASGPLFCNTSNPVTSCISEYNAVGSDFGSVVPKSLQQPYSDHSLSFSPSGKVPIFLFLQQMIKNRNLLNNFSGLLLGFYCSRWNGECEC